MITRYSLQLHHLKKIFRKGKFHIIQQKYGERKKVLGKKASGEKSS